MTLPSVPTLTAVVIICALQNETCPSLRGSEVIISEIYQVKSGETVN